MDSTTSIHIGRLVILFHKLLFPPLTPQKLIKYGYGTNSWDTTFLFLGKKMFPTSLGKTKSHDFHCEVCEFAKYHHIIFPIRNEKKKLLLVQDI